VLLGLFDCSSAASKSAAKAVDSGVAASVREASVPDAPPALPDVVFTMDGHINGGGEAMYCLYVSMPADRTTAVPSAESRYTPGSHHFLAFRTNLTAIPDGGGVSHVCGGGGTNGINSGEALNAVTGSYYEAQTPIARRDLPSGVAHVFQPSEILALTAHYLNPSASPIDAHVEFRLHTMDPAAVKEEAGTFFLLDPQINIPPYSDVTVTRSCPIPQDVNLGLLWSHMHSRGYEFKAWTDDSAATQRVGGNLYEQPGPDGWAEPHVQTYPVDPPVTLHAGSNLSFSCNYHNTTPQTFGFGQSAATAEMCLLHGMYWPRLDGKTEQCLSGTSGMTSVTPTDGGAPSGAGD
jgi:hypothetical protein